MMNEQAEPITDVSDMATAREELDREAAMIEARRNTHHLTPNGRCYYCGELVDDEHVFCDAECSHAWDQEQSAILRNRGPRGARH